MVPESIALFYSTFSFDLFMYSSILCFYGHCLGLELKTTGLDLVHVVLEHILGQTKKTRPTNADFT